MRVESVYFLFRGWTFLWLPYKKKIVVKGRKTTVWKVIARRHTKEIFIWESKSFVPSACACRRIKRRVMKDI